MTLNASRSSVREECAEIETEAPDRTADLRPDYDGPQRTAMLSKKVHYDEVSSYSSQC